MDKADTNAIRERTKRLREEIAQICVANRLYRKEHYHHPADTTADIERRSRLVEIAGELASLSSGTNVRKKPEPNE